MEFKELGDTRESFNKKIGGTVVTNQDNRLMLNNLDSSDSIFRFGLIFDHREFYTKSSAFYAGYASD